LVTYNGLPFYTAMQCGALDAAKQLGGKIEISMQGPPHGMVVNEELPIFDALINSKPSGIILVPADPRALIPSVQRAMKSGVPVVTTDQALSEEAALGHFGANNTQGGQVAAEELLKELNGKGGTVAIVDGKPGLPVTNDRATGAINTLKSHSEIKLLPTIYYGQDPNKAAAAISAAITAHPDLVGIITTAEQGAMGAAAALQAVPKDKRPIVIGYDPGPDVVQALKDGRLNAIVAQGSYTEGYDAVTALVKYIRSGGAEKISPYSTLLPNVVVTPANITQPEIAKLLYPDKCPSS
jgi:ribose transport system substrate-binding protein